jgi:hypothetical protein
MSDNEAMSASAKRLGDEAERLTRRNMKICVTEHIQTKCFDDPSFARPALQPRKSMINCFRYINRQAQDFLKKEMEETGERPVGDCYGNDVPDDLCYGWAEDYFRDPDAPEDAVKDEKFVPKPYYGGVSSQKPKSKKKEPAKPKPVPIPTKEPVHSDSAQQQLSLAEV